MLSVILVRKSRSNRTRRKRELVYLCLSFILKMLWKETFESQRYCSIVSNAFRCRSMSTFCVFLILPSVEKLRAVHTVIATAIYLSQLMGYMEFSVIEHLHWLISFRTHLLWSKNSQSQSHHVNSPLVTDKKSKP